MTVQTLDDVGELAQQIDRALASVGSGGQPTVILARTRKGRGFSEVEDREGVVGQGVAAGGAGLERDGASGEGVGSGVFGACGKIHQLSPHRPVVFTPIRACQLAASAP